MPEGPEVETIRRSIESDLIGKKIKRVLKSDFPLRRNTTVFELKRLVGLKVLNSFCHGKLMCVELESNCGLFIHLGMTGQLLLESKSLKKNHTHVEFYLEGNDNSLKFVDPRRFGCVIPYFSELEKLGELAKLGPNPLKWSEREKEIVAKRISKSSRAIKEILLDQSVLAGVGNIYASESLFLAKISPFKSASSININDIKKLVNACAEVLQIGLDNCGTSFSDYVDGYGNKGTNIDYVKVFQRYEEPCYECGDFIAKKKQSGRTTFYCPTCQRL